MNAAIADNLDAIRALAREYGVIRLEVFGSVCTPDWNAVTSDIDFLIQYPPGYDFGPWLGRLQDLEAALGSVVGRKVDLVTTRALDTRWVRQEAAKTRTVVFDAAEDCEVT